MRTCDLEVFAKTSVAGIISGVPSLVDNHSNNQVRFLSRDKAALLNYTTWNEFFALLILALLIYALILLRQRATGGLINSNFIFPA